jgi:hypothetical protein
METKKEREIALTWFGNRNSRSSLFRIVLYINYKIDIATRNKSSIEIKSTDVTT